MKPRILVIRGGAIGDFILTLPAIRLLRENFPDARLEILGYEHIIELARGRFYADATRSIEYGPMAGFFVPNSKLAPDLVEYFASFQQVISYLFDPDLFFENNLRRAGVKNFLAAYARIDDSQHAAQQLARPLQKLALFLEDAAARLHPSEEDQAAGATVSRRRPTTPVIAIHPGSGSPRKNWPAENWAALGRWLHETAPQTRLLLIGGEADAAQIATVQTALREADVLLAQNLPLPHLAAVLQRCRLFLGHDSGISHLAAAVGTPCVLLFGPTDPAVWAPANPGREGGQRRRAVIFASYRRTQCSRRCVRPWRICSNPLPAAWAISTGEMGSACALARPARRPRRADSRQSQGNFSVNVCAEAVFGKGAESSVRGACATHFQLCKYAGRTKRNGFKRLLSSTSPNPP